MTQGKETDGSLRSPSHFRYVILTAGKNLSLAKCIESTAHSERYGC